MPDDLSGKFRITRLRLRGLPDPVFPGDGLSLSPLFIERARSNCLRIDGLPIILAEEVAKGFELLGGSTFLGVNLGGSDSATLFLAGSRSDVHSIVSLLRDGEGEALDLAKSILDIERRISSRPALTVRGENLLEVKDCLIMGIVNITPDSFSDGGKFLDREKAIAQAAKLTQDGADILDLGAESSRPGSDPVPAEEELERLLPVLSVLRQELPDIPISVDTTKSSVASAALDSGADIINDISAGRFDDKMFGLCASSKAPIVLMHMRGKPKTMQEAPSYDNAVSEVASELLERVRSAEEAGLGEGMIVVDPGIGFGKRPQDNAALIGHVEALSALGYPVLVGASRKSFIGAVSGAGVDDRLPGTLAVHSAAFMNGASILRVHDVAEHRQALACLNACVMGQTFST